MTGLTTAELRDERPGFARVVVPALLFVAGFSLVFVAMGASASVLGQLFSAYRGVIEKVAGIAIVAFGVVMLGVIKVPWLYGEARFGMERSRSMGRGAALVMGMAFAAGWTPCVGPILGAILALAGSYGSVAQGALLLVAYSAGLGVPFVLVAVVFGRLTPLLARVQRHSLVINRVAGALLIVVGILIVTGQLGVLSSWLVRVLPTFEIPLPALSR
jgi:cytochrome c-type biogenesis protein